MRAAAPSLPVPWGPRVLGPRQGPVPSLWSGKESFTAPRPPPPPPPPVPLLSPTLSSSRRCIWTTESKIGARFSGFRAWLSHLPHLQDGGAVVVVGEVVAPPNPASSSCPWPVPPWETESCGCRPASLPLSPLPAGPLRSCLLVRSFPMRQTLPPLDLCLAVNTSPFHKTCFPRHSLVVKLGQRFSSKARTACMCRQRPGAPGAPCSCARVTFHFLKSPAPPPGFSLCGHLVVPSGNSKPLYPGSAKGLTLSDGPGRGGPE